MASDMHALHIPSTVVELPPDWSWKRLDTVCEGVFDCPHSTPVLSEDGPYLARSQDMRSGVFRTDEAAHVSEAIYSERIGRAEPQHGDLLYSREGTYFGIAAEVPAGVRVCLGQRMVLLRPSPSAVSFRFLRYWLNSPVMVLHTGGHRDGSVAERLNLPTIRALPIAVPPLPEQRAIAHILGTLDDKIELNRRMNETLEAMARALFKSWFVDFDPVRANMEGRDPGLPQSLADLFPARLVDSELGEIPEGWEVGSLLDMAGLLSGGTPNTSIAHYWNGDIPWVSAKDVSSAAGSFLLKTEKTISRDGLYNSNTKILPAYTTIITARGTVGNYCLLGEDMAMNQTNYGLRAKEGVGDYFIFLATATLIEHLQQHSYGTIFDTITTKTFRDTMTVQPPQRMLAIFDRIIQPFMARILSSEVESRALTALRDALLPKLISGELRVPDAGRFIGAAQE